MSEYGENDIAVVAMECKIPMASDPDMLWNLLNDRKCSITDLSNSQLEENGINASVYSSEDYVRKASILGGIDGFDAPYFDMSNIEADVLDVQQRMMLQSAILLLNRANIDPDRYSKRMGVFAGCAFSSYLFGVLARNDLVASLGEMIIRHGNDKDFLATRLSYKLNLTGPSLNIQSSCSTGLVAIHCACQSLLLNECDDAIAGAVCIKVPQDTGYLYQQNGVLSPDGICRPFDKAANGTMFANGLGLVLLKRMEDALADGDEIHAVVKGSAINNDGANKVSFTAPSISGQANVLREAIEVSGIEKSEIQYIETHGTGTNLGDPIEAEAIKLAYGDQGERCGLGSLKSNFGHFNIAAGIIGFIKAVLILKHKKIPAMINFDTPNPKLGLEGSRFYIADKANELDSTKPLNVAVSAFGMGGTNSHAILQCYDGGQSLEGADKNSDGKHFGIYTLSAFSKPSLDKILNNHIDYFSNGSCDDFHRAAYTAYSSRRIHKCRLSFVANSTEDASEVLLSKNYNRLDVDPDRKMAFVFSGQGTQHIEMGKDLSKRHALFNEYLQSILGEFKDKCGLDLSNILWDKDRSKDIVATELAQPLLFSVEYALAKTLMEKGVKPDYVFGHSLGELVAATISGIFSVSDAISIVFMRSKLMSACSKGSMLAIEKLEHAKSFIESGDLSIAAYNSPIQTVVSGDDLKIKELQVQLDIAGHRCQSLSTSHAFHSDLMTNAAEKFYDFMKGLEFGEMTIPLVSNITGKVISEYEYRNPRYWADHIVKPVDFVGSIKTLAGLSVSEFIEIGRGRSMSNLILSNSDSFSGQKPIAIQTLDSEEECRSFMNVFSYCWSSGKNVDLTSFFHKNEKTSIPLYQFNNKRHWVKPIIGFQPVADFNVKGSRVVESVDSPSDENNKENARALEHSSTRNQVIDSKVVAEVEDAIIEIYEKYIGVHVNSNKSAPFFTLGGNSLMAIRAIAELREKFSLDIPIACFYDKSSVEDMTSHILDSMSENKEVERPTGEAESSSHVNREEFLEENPVEGMVAIIYKEFLGEENVDSNNSFFDMGGNSLLAIQVISRLREIFQIDLPISGFYQQSTISDISMVIARKVLDKEVVGA